jgi:hypothetical protein
VELRVSRIPPPAVEQPPTSFAAPGAPMAGPNEISTVALTFRAVRLSRVAASANVPDTDLVYALEAEVKACPLFDAQKTTLSPEITPDEQTGTFTFGMTLALNKPLKL